MCRVVERVWSDAGTHSETELLLSEPRTQSTVERDGVVEARSRKLFRWTCAGLDRSSVTGRVVSILRDRFKSDLSRGENVLTDLVFFYCVKLERDKTIRTTG